MEDCVFCKIAEQRLPSHKIWENDDFLAILDIRPVVKGMTVVMPKKHYGSRVFEMKKDLYLDFLEAGYETARLLKKALGSERVFMVIEGVDVDHAHLKLYPVKEEKPLGLLLEQAHQKENEKSEELNKIKERIKEYV